MKQTLQAPLDILAFAAHPDDVELSAAGTMILAARKGLRTGIVDLTRGELGTRGTVTERKREAEAAGRIMGIKVRENLGMPDGALDDTQENVMKVVEALRAHKPKIVLAPHWFERHPDHEATSRIVRKASFLAGLQKIITRRDGKVQLPHRPDRMFCYMQTYEFTPSFIVDISLTFKEKEKAIKAYGSQFHNPRSREPITFIARPEYLKELEARARHFGFQIHSKYGEPFFAIEPVAVKGMEVFL